LLRLDDLMTSYTHARPIVIPEKSVFRLVSRAGSTGRCNTIWYKSFF